MSDLINDLVEDLPVSGNELDVFEEEPPVDEDVVDELYWLNVENYDRLYNIA